MTEQPRFFIATLGCKVNQYESRALREAWLGRGLREAADPALADVILVNSCAVTARAVADVRALVRRLNRAAPGANIIISGCAAEVLPRELSRLPGVGAVVGQSDKAGLLCGVPAPGIGNSNPESPAGHPCSGQVQSPAPPAPVSSLGGSESPALYPPFAVSGYDRSRAVLKIQDGCSHGCAYCIVPLARGPARSRGYDDALREARRLLEAGFREIIISGVNLRQFRLGSEPRAGFWDFLSRLDAALAPEWGEKARLRISSLEPGQLGPRALDALHSCAMVAPHLHLSLQSGSPSVLRRMGRGHYDPARLPEFSASLRRIWPVYGLGADILTGFPGETEEEFLRGLDLCEALPLTYAHVFPYSGRPGTRAAAMSGQVPPDVKKDRAARLRALVWKKKEDFLASLLRLPFLRVVFENRDGSAPLRGVSEFYADCRLPAAGATLPLREIVAARPLAVKDGGLVVEPASGRREAE